VKDGNLYGIGCVIKQYAAVSNMPISYAFEHGLYFGEYVPVASYYRTTKSIITFSDHRKNIIQSKLDKHVIAIGPYIHYANSLLGESEIDNIKKKYGKILLFFFAHGTREGGEYYNVPKIICKLNEIRKEKRFDSVFVCMYYYDLLNTCFAQMFTKANFEIITAGHVYDINFLARLKSIIGLADYVVTNDVVGTSLGYCVYMKKPCFIIHDIIEDSYSRIDYYR
jgi:hypothetical protein